MKRVILTGAVALALTACQTAGETFDAVNPFSDSVSIETRLIDQYLAEQGLDDADFPVPEAARRTPDLLPPGTGTEVAYADHYGVLEIPAAERELNAILQRLQATIPGTPPPARVYIEPGVGFSARAEKSGAIFVSFGGLSGTSPQGESDEADLNDDRLAFLIAHEYAHILLDHFGDRETEESMLEFAKLARMGLVARNKLDEDRDDDDLARNMRAPNVALAVSEATMLRSWGRSQEFEADLLAHDLLAAAGYNRRESSNAITRIRDVKDVVQQVPFFNSEEFQSIAAQALQGGMDKQNLVERGVDAGFVLFGQLSRELFGKEHPSQQDRLDQLKLYEERQYREVERAYVARFTRSRSDSVDRLAADSDFQGWKAAYDTTFQAVALTERSKVAGVQGSDGSMAEADAPPILDPAFEPTFKRARAALQRLGQEDPFLRERFAELREHERKHDTAIANLDLVLEAKGERTPLKTLLELVNRNLDKGDVARAGEAIQLAVLNYPDAQAWYPNKIAVELLSGQRDQAQRTFDSCQINGTVTTTVACREVARGKGPGFNGKGQDAPPGLLKQGGSVPGRGETNQGGGFDNLINAFTGT